MPRIPGEYVSESERSSHSGSEPRRNSPTGSHSSSGSSVYEDAVERIAQLPPTPPSRPSSREREERSPVSSRSSLPEHEPMYTSDTDSWHYRMGSTLFTAVPDRARRTWGWAVENRDNIVASVTGASTSIIQGASILAAGPSQLPQTPAQAGYGSGVALAALVGANEVARELMRRNNINYPNLGAGLSAAAGFVGYGIGASGRLGPTASYYSQGVGPVVAGLGAGAAPFTRNRPPEEPGLPLYNNPSASTARQSVSRTSQSENGQESRRGHRSSGSHSSHHHSSTTGRSSEQSSQNRRRGHGRG